MLTMRVMTYNIHGWRTADNRPNAEMVGRVIAASGADIVGLNEVYYPRAAPGRERPALEELAEGLGMHFVFGPCLRYPANEELPADAYGNALLSRWPIAASAAHLLGTIEGKEQRGLLEARILMPDGATFTVYVTHLDHTDEETRLAQFRAARLWMGRDRNRPHLVMGDMNAVSAWDFAGQEEKLVELAGHPTASNQAAQPEGPRLIAAFEKAGYIDVYRRFGPPGKDSFIRPADEIPTRIDFIFASAPLAEALEGCEIWYEPADEEASDHRPLIADIAYGSV